MAPQVSSISCKCGRNVMEWVSFTQKNSGRRFVRCANRARNCGFWKWIDDPISPLVRSVISGLENATAVELPYAEHRLCVKHLHANWSKKYLRKRFKDLMWEAARAPNVPYFEVVMADLKAVSTEAYEALEKIERKKWTKCAFMKDFLPFFSYDFVKDFRRGDEGGCREEDEQLWRKYQSQFLNLRTNDLEWWMVRLSSHHG